MSTTTTNLGLTKPAGDELIDIAVWNDNMDLIDAAVGELQGLVTKVKGDAESEYRTGNVNLTPANIGAAAAVHSHDAATTSAAGFMSSTDKSKLDGIASGAQVNSITGIKGNAESSYRTGNVNLTPANIGAASQDSVTWISKSNSLKGFRVAKDNSPHYLELKTTNTSNVTHYILFQTTNISVYDANWNLLHYVDWTE